MTGLGGVLSLLSSKTFLGVYEVLSSIIEG